MSVTFESLTQVEQELVFTSFSVQMPCVWVSSSMKLLLTMQIRLLQKSPSMVW